MSTRKPVPLTVIGGYLGAGKTTLLNQMLRDAGGRRIAVLVNDFGSINIDADLIASHDGETINLANGCICCSLVDGYAQALGQLRQRAEHLDHVVVEASGVADPLRVGQYGAILNFVLDGVVVVVDAEQIRERAANRFVGETVLRQLRGADLLVLNKRDLVTPDLLAETRGWLAGVAPGARIVEASQGEVPLEVLLGAPLHHDRSLAADEPDLHADLYETWSMVREEPMTREEVEQFVQELPPRVLRAKGIVHLREDPDRRYVLQVTGQRQSLSPLGPWHEETPVTKIVVIAVR